jgi:hypothetical protein
MPYNARNYYMRLTLPEMLLSMLPTVVRKEWSKVEKAQAKVTDAATMLPILEAAAKEAPTADEQAAREAAQAGKPMPPVTAPGAVAAADDKRREVKALQDIAADTERDFMRLLNDHRPEITTTLRKALADAVTAADDALTAAEVAMTDVSMLAGLWRWSKSGDDQMHAKRLTAEFYGVSQDAATFVGIAAARVGAEHPDRMDAEEARRQAEWEESRGIRATPDGIVVDHAAWSELS